MACHFAGTQHAAKICGTHAGEVDHVVFSGKNWQNDPSTFLNRQIGGMSHPPRIVQTRILARTRLFEIEQVDLQFANGTAVQYERLRGSAGGAVLIVPVLNDDTILLIREYAVGVERYELGPPKGRVEVDEDILSAANREMQEEVGYAARSLVHLTTLTLAPGCSNQQTHVVLARDLYVSPAVGDEPEPLQVIPVRIVDLPQLLTHHELTEARSIAALLLAQQYLLSHHEK
jgi:ADP-ribose diphosphatase